MQIVFIGAGYVGLVSSTMMASLGFYVKCYDKDESKISLLKNNVMPIYEPGLKEYVKAGVLSKRLGFESDLPKKADVVFIAVGTPPLESGEADISYVYEAVLSVAKKYPSNTLIVIKSTVPPGTALALEEMLRKNSLDHKIANNPEFLREGNAIEDFINPDRLIVGVSDEESACVLRSLYEPLTSKGCIMLTTNLTTSELIKYASNSFLATKIGFINEMANLCERVGADIDSLSIGMGLDARIGAAFLKAGPGFGGSCFPKDLLALSHLAKAYGQPCHILDSVIFSNKNRPSHMVSKISNVIGDLKDMTLHVLGITFKAGTDDVRSSPAVDIVELMLSQGANVKIYDPEGAKNGAEILPKGKFIEDAYEGLSEADAVVVLTEWEEFKSLDFVRIRETIKSPYIFDFRNIFDEREMLKLGFNYFKVGK